MNTLTECSRLWCAPDSGDVYAVGVGDTQIATGLTREHARRIVACVNACIGIPTAQLEAMNAQQIGLLARAYDVCSEIVEDWRHEFEDAAPIPGADAVDTLSRVGGDALAVCRWALASDNGLNSVRDLP